MAIFKTLLPDAFYRSPHVGQDLLAPLDDLEQRPRARARLHINVEEDAVELTDEMPFLLETRMTERGAAFVAGENFKANVITDGRLVTGQNPASAKGTAEQVVIAIERSR